MAISRDIYLANAAAKRADKRLLTVESGARKLAAAKTEKQRAAALEQIERNSDALREELNKINALAQ